MPKALKQKQEYGIPLSRYTVFLQNCPLGHDPKIAEFLGYESIYSFSRAFKRHFGYPPSSLEEEY